VTDDMSVVSIVRTLIRNVKVVLTITVFFAAAAAIYAWLDPVVYRATVEFAVVPPPFSANAGTIGVGSALSGIGQALGLGLPGANRETALEIETLKSRAMVQEFIQKYGLAAILDKGAHIKFRDDPVARTDAEDRYFRNKIRSIDPTTAQGVYDLNIDWANSSQAAEWANEFMKFANDRERARDAMQYESEIQFLRERMATESAVDVQDALAARIADEEKNLSLTANINGYIFHIIDPAYAPQHRLRPLRTLIVLLATITGFIIAVLFVLMRDSLRRAG
jgi:uncharacterized protein involved in exopolysaccharide biosynthesis